MSDFRLKTFLSVVKNKSFTKAANELHITQPAVSKNIKELEKLYKVRLFDRNGSTILLTKTGEIFLSHAEKIMDSYSNLQYEMNRISKSFIGELNIGASTTIAQYIIPTLLSQFMKTYPNLKLNLINGNSQDIEESLIEKKIDIGLVEGKHQNPSVKYTPFLDDEIVLVTRVTSIYGELDSVDVNKLMFMPIVLREQGSGTLEVISARFNEIGINIDNMNILLHLGSSESIKNFLLVNDCVALISIKAVINELKAGIFKIIDIDDFQIERELRICTLHGSNNLNVETFINFINSHNQKL